MKRRRALDGLADDIRDHVERETQDNIGRGMAPAEARLAALRKFGNVTRAMEDTRAVWRRAWVDHLLQDLRYGARFLRHNPRFAAVAVLTLALGIGMNTAVFSVADTVVLKPVSYPNAERLVWIADYDPNLHHDTVWGGDYATLRRDTRSYSAIAGFGYEQAAISTPRGAVQVSGVWVDAEFWRVTGARPALGALPEEGDRQSMVISWDLFQREFGADPSVIGRPLTVDERPAQIAAVLPMDFRFQFPMWWTEAHPEPVEAYFAAPSETERLRLGSQVVALLKPGAGVPQAQAEMQVIEQHIRERDRLAVSTRLRVERLQDAMTGGVRRGVLLLLAAGAMVLLIACANIANLLLARGAVRQREIAIRAAVGAGRMRIVRQLLAESVLLALAGGAAGLVLARWAVAALVRTAPTALPRLREAAIDSRALAFTLAISVATGMVFGAGPAIALWRTNLHDALKSGARAPAGGGGMRLRRLLVAMELSLAIVVLTGAGLVWKSFLRMNARPAGFVPEQVIVMRGRHLGTPDKVEQRKYAASVLREVADTPGVRESGIGTWFLFGGVKLPADADPSHSHVIRMSAVSPGYPQALGMTLIRGRWLTDGDTDAALLNESLAREAFGGADPIGRQVTVNPTYTIVGVVGDLKYSKLDAAAPAEAYVPLARSPGLFGLEVVARVSGDPAPLTRRLQQRVSGADPRWVIHDAKTLDRVLADSIAPRRFDLFLLGAFALCALALALVGIYGMMAWSVAERTREIGVRMALGAGRGQVAGMVVREAAAIAVAGSAAGLAAAWGMSRLVATLLYDVKPTDPVVFGAVCTLLAVAAVAASVVPAMRAASVDPTVSLRYE